MKNRAWLTVFCLAALAAGAQEALSPEAFMQMGHSEGIIVVAYSPDGRRIVTSSFDKTVKVWDADSGRELRTLAGHSSRVESIAYSPDSRRIVSGSADMTIKIWDAEAGREIRTLTGHSGKVMSTVYSPDGRRIVSGSGDRTLKIWDTETGREIRTLTGHSLGVETAVYSPDGRRIASGSNDKTIKIWDAETGREIRTITGHTEALDEVSFSPDGKRIVSTSSAKDIKIWDAETGGELRTILVGDFVYSARFSPNGNQILCVYGDMGIKIFDTETGREIRSFAGHSNVVWGVAWSPDGKRILSGSDDWTAKIWDAATGAEIMTLGIPAPLTRDMIAEYLALAGDSAAKTGAFSGPSLYRAGPRETALQFGALVSKALAETRFLDPQNSAALRRCEALLQSITGKGGVSRAELDTYYRQAIGTLIAEVGDTEFNKMDFDFPKGTSITYGAILMRDAKTGHFKLIYERPSVQNDDKEISAPTLEALVAEMQKNRTDFDETSIRSVKANAALIPAVVYADWKARGIADGVDAIGLIKEAITGFYTTPSQDAYKALLSIVARYYQAGSINIGSFAHAAYMAFTRTLKTLCSEEFSDKVWQDAIHKGDLRTLYGYNPVGRNYSIFSRPR